MKLRENILISTSFIVFAFASPLLQHLPAANGELDPGFGTGGKVVDAPAGGDESGLAIASQIDGKLVVVGGGGGDKIAGGDFLVVRYNPDGSLDGSFGSGGQVFTDFSGGSDEAHAVAIQADGKIVVAGRTGIFANFQLDERFALARYNTDGTLDASFGAGGLVTTASSGEDWEANALLIQPDGKIVAAGSSNSTAGLDFALARYNLDGSLDSSFGTGGLVTTDLDPDVGYRDEAFGVALQADGKLVAAGGSPTDPSTLRFFFVRYNTNGSLDPTFGSGGIQIHDVGNDSYHTGMARAVAIQADGRIVAVGDSNLTDNGGFPITSDFAIMRLNTNGSLDGGFSSDGVAQIDFSGHNDVPNAVIIQPDGRIVVVGAVDLDIVSEGFSSHYRGVVGVARYNTFGTPDSTFGTDGKVTVPFGDLVQSAPFSNVLGDYPADAARGMALQADGKIVTVGRAAFPGTGNDVAVTRLNANGSLDGTFAGTAKVFTDFGLPGVNKGNAVITQPDGKVLVAEDGRQFELARYNEDGTLDTTFGNGGHAVAPFTDSAGFLPAVATSLTLQEDGRIVLAGRVFVLQNNAANYKFCLARFNANGTLDANFGTAGTVISAFDTDAAVHVAVQLDGKIVLAGISPANSPTGTDFVVARYENTGEVDTGFASGGRVTTDFSDITDNSDVDDANVGIVIQADGRIVLAGNNRGGFDETDKLLLARYNSDGHLDETFGAAGRVALENPVFAADLALQSDGKLIVAGTINNSGNKDMALIRFNTDGAIDTGFGTNGVASADFGLDERTNAVAIEPGGHIAVAGESQQGFGPSDFLVARCRANGTFDTSFGAGGGTVTDFFDEDDVAIDLAITPDGKIVAAGSVTDIARRIHLGLARYEVSTTAPARGQLLNIATRLRVQSGENVLIGGLIITGSDPKKVMIRGIGPSLAQFFSDALGDPVLELFQGSTPLASNDNWVDSPEKAEIEASGIAPSNDLESAIVRTLDPGAYTAVMSGKDGGTGIGVVEAYDLDLSANSKLGNIATRGFVDAGDNVMIGGLIAGGNGGAITRVLVRAIGPALANAGIAGALQDPTLELRDGNGALVRENDNWQEDQQAEIEATTIPPSNAAESAIVATLTPGNYTAIVRGKNDTTGVGLVEVYNVD